jgi:outer membrane protein OmpA-like peptidoglycan-associated protein
MQIFSAGKPARFMLLVSSAALFAACGGTTVFSGKGPVAISGDLPAPPPPPPVEAPKPPEPPPKVVVKDNKIEITEKIQFEYNKAVILPQSFALMDEIAATLKKNPHIKKVAIEGHASSEGDPKRNLKLSDERAKAVQTYLVEKGGIAAAALTAKGYGITKPIADNATEEGKEKNRRVEFTILEQDVTKKKVEVDASGKETVVEEKTLSEKKELPEAPAVEDKAKDKDKSKDKDKKKDDKAPPKKPADKDDKKKDAK